MIERFDLDAKGQADKVGAWFWVDDVEHLLRPPTWIVDPVKGDIPVHYTPAQWRQWFVDNRVPVQEWTGPMWYRTVTDISGPMDWIIMGSVEAAARFYEGEKHSFESRIIHDEGYQDNLTCDGVVANEAGKPPDDYACES